MIVPVDDKAGAQPIGPAMPVANPGRWTGYQVWLIASLVAVSVCNSLDRGIVSLLQEPIKNDLSLSDAQLGMITGPAFGLLYGVFGLPMARLAERLNRTNLLAAIIALWSGMTALCGTAQSFWQMIIFRSLVGVGESGANPVSHSLIGDEFSVRQRGLAMSVLSAAVPLAGVIAPITLGAIAYSYGWRTAFFFAAIPGLVVAVLIKLTVREPRLRRVRSGEVQPFRIDAAWLVRNRAFVMIWFASAFNAIGIIGLSGFGTSFLIRNRGMALDELGLAVGSFGVAGLLGTFIGGWAADRFSDARGRSYAIVPMVGAILSFLSLSIAFRVETLTGALLGLFIANIATDIKNGPNYAAVQNIVPSRMRATGAAFLFLAATVVGGSLGPLLVGIVSDSAAGHAFSLGDYHALCLSHSGAEGAVAAACKAASTTGLQFALGILPFTFLAAALFFWLASRKIEINDE